MCQACEKSCQQDVAAAADATDEEAPAEDEGRRLVIDYDACVDKCDKIENMEENGYIDATEFLKCQMVNDREGDVSGAYFAGPMCASLGTKIKIGIFTDENCASRFTIFTISTSSSTHLRMQQVKVSILNEMNLVTVWPNTMIKVGIDTCVYHLL
jgi:NAD-dependent dihydropyrimidine dehydrogenase PreA subunit